MLVIISIIGMAIVAVILFMGLWNMAKGGSPNRSQKLMRLRILFQFLAVIAVMATLYFTTR
ncbi:MAG: twin transmembrane helix small protein [Pseudomonadota bacterium]